MREPTDWEVIEYTCEVLADIRKRLKAGAEGAGATLDADECAKVLAALADPPFPNHSPVDNTLRDAAIIQDVALRERGMLRPQAVAESAKLFGVSKEIVRRLLRERAKVRTLKK